MKGFLTLLVLAGVGGGIFALGSLRRESDDKPLLHVAKEVALKVNTAKPAKEDIVRLVQAPGDVEAVLEVDISSEIFAKIEEMPIEEGDRVKKGDLLCRLNDDNILADIESAKARVAQLQASIVQAEADFEKAKRDVDRQKSLSESAATSLLEIADYMTVYKKAKAACDMGQQVLIQAKAGLKRLDEDLKRTVITSPIDGVISKLSAKQGEVVITGTMNNPGTVIMTISDLSKMQVRTRVDEVDVPSVRPGQKARIYLQSDPDTPVAARVTRVASRGSRPSGRDVVTFETLLEVLSNDSRIKPGMTANVEIEVAERAQTITIPIEAIVHRMRRDLPEDIVKELDERQADVDLSARARQAQYIKVIYVMEEEIAKVRLVDVGIADARRAEIRRGVVLEDTVVIGPYRSLDQLKDGKKIALLEEKKKKPDGESAKEEKVAGENGSEPPPEDKGEKVASGTSP